MSNFKNDLDYTIHKAKIGLTAGTLIKTANLYNQLINENTVDIIANDLANLPEKNFDNIEKIRASWQDNHNLAFMSQVDSIIYRLNSGEGPENIKTEMVNNAAIFPSTADNIHKIWQVKYNLPTIMDSYVEASYKNPQDEELIEQTNYILNKASCSLNLYNISQNIIDEINLADNSVDKQIHLDLAKSNKVDFLNFYDLYTQGYKQETILDQFIAPEIDSQLNELYKSIAHANDIQTQLLGVDHTNS